jgi:hypothetical protein
MPPVTNPHLDDPAKASAFELGYLAGFHDPAGNDNDFLPLAPELLDIYVEGADVGRSDAHAPPFAGPAMVWVPKSDLEPGGESSIDELDEHIAQYHIFKLLEEITANSIFGLFDVVLMVLPIQGNTIPQQFQPPQPLEDDFSEDFDFPHSDAVFYVAACPRSNHMGDGAKGPGLWTGEARHDFKDALRDAMHHGHRETLIARCNLEMGTCGVVWLAKAPN